MEDEYPHLANRIFLWKACLEGLPTNLNIFNKMVVDNPKFPICFEEKYVIHALWSCLAAQSLCSKQIQKSAYWKQTFLVLFEVFCLGFETTIVEDIAMVAMRIWQKRNQFVFQSEFKHPKLVVQHSKEVLKS